MKREKQIEESKNMIGDALLSLLKHNELKDIPVSRITTKAKVSRVTFYRNFECWDEVEVEGRCQMESIFLSGNGINTR